MFQTFQQRRWPLTILWVVIVAAIVAAPAVLPGFRLNLLGRFLSLAIVALGIDLIWGFTGLLILGQASFLPLVDTWQPCIYSWTVQRTCPMASLNFSVFSLYIFWWFSDS